MKRLMYCCLFVVCAVTLLACGKESVSIDTYTGDSSTYTKDVQVEKREQEELTKNNESTKNHEQEIETSENVVEEKMDPNTTTPPATDSKEHAYENTTPPPVVSEKPAESERVSKVSISIDTKTILNNMEKVAQNKKAYVPSDGWILAPITVEIKEGDTVFDVLSRVTRDRRIHMEFQGADQNIYNSVYIQGIAQLYEFDCGELSGWMYTINGAYVSKGASSVKVEDGMNIEWRYTCDLGRDLGL